MTGPEKSGLVVCSAVPGDWMLAALTASINAFAFAFPVCAGALALFSTRSQPYAVPRIGLVPAVTSSGEHKEKGACIFSHLQ